MAEWMNIAECEVMHNADRLLEHYRGLAATIVTAKRISVPRKMAADSA